MDNAARGRPAHTFFVRLAWLTDIHLDFLEAPARDALARALRAEAPDGVLVTGDIATASTLPDLLGELADEVDRPLWFVLGNHDYYRGTIASVRRWAERAHLRQAHLAWLPAAGVVRISDDTALIGHDGWGDARLGDFAGTRVRLNDFVYIEDLAGLPKAQLRPKLEALGDEAAAHLARVAAEALAWASHVICAIHVPPWREACWHEGALSGDDWLPFFTCAAAGDALVAAMRAHPAARMTVLCGHTHSGGEAEILPNLRVVTGAAKYGSPAVQRVIEV